MGVVVVATFFNMATVILRLSFAFPLWHCGPGDAPLPVPVPVPFPFPVPVPLLSSCPFVDWINRPNLWGTLTVLTRSFSLFFPPPPFCECMWCPLFVIVCVKTFLTWPQRPMADYVCVCASVCGCTCHMARSRKIIFTCQPKIVRKPCPLPRHPPFTDYATCSATGSACSVVMRAKRASTARTRARSEMKNGQKWLKISMESVLKPKDRSESQASC